MYHTINEAFYFSSSNKRIVIRKTWAVIATMAPKAVTISPQNKKGFTTYILSQFLVLSYGMVMTCFEHNTDGKNRMANWWENASAHSLSHQMRVWLTCKVVTLSVGPQIYSSQVGSIQNWAVRVLWRCSSDRAASLMFFHEYILSGALNRIKFFNFEYYW